MIALQPQSFTRSRIESAENPPKITVCGAPIREHARIATANSGTSGIYTATRSPFSTPRCFRTFANFETSAWSSRYESRRSSPGSPSQIRAVLSPFVSRWRSRQLYEAFIFPPENHFACGGSQSSTFSHGANQSRDSACFAQNAGRSASASAYIFS